MNKKHETKNAKRLHLVVQTAFFPHVYFFLLAVFCFLFTAASPISSLQSPPPTPQPPPPTPQPPDPNPQFGVIESPENPQAAAELGVGWTRITFQWAEVQAGGPGTWTPKIDDAQLDAEIAAGREVVGLLIGIPDWARDENLLPQGLRLPPADPENTWATFVREAVGRYNGRIHHWVIWNEPDIAATEIAHTWDGSVTDFAQLQRTAYLVAKEVDPTITIHLAAFTYWADVYAGTEQTMARLLDELLADPAAAQHNAYFDVATAHLYFQPNQIYDLLTLFQDIMRRRGLAQPIWLVETNAPPVDDPAWPVGDHHLYVTQAEQAAFMPQALAAALAAGAERIAVYKLQDTDTDRAANPEPFGLLRQNGEQRPAFTTYQVAIQHLAQAQHVERLRWDGVGQFRLDQPDRTTMVLFNRLFFSQEAAVAAVAPTALLVDQWGTAQPITATHGVYTVTLPAAPCSQPIGDYCMIGGPTFYLVQANNGGAPPDLPVPTATPTPMPTPTASLTPTPTATAPPTASATAVPATAVSLPTLIFPDTATPLPSETAVRPATSALPPPFLWLVLALVCLVLLFGGAAWLRRRSQ